MRTREGEGAAGIALYAQSEFGAVGYATSTAVSGNDGRFRFEGLADEPHVIEVCMRGRERARVQHVAPGTTDVVLVLAEAGRVRGRALDADGRPLERFRVEVCAADAALPELGAVVAEKTVIHAPEGAFDVGGLPPGEHVVRITVEGLAPSASASFRASFEAPAEVEVRVTTGGTLTGVVLDSASDAPIPGAEVVPLRRTYPWVWSFERASREHASVWDPDASREAGPATRTDATGRFTLEHLPPGSHLLRFRAAGHADARIEGVATEGAITELAVLRMSAGATVRGTVYAKAETIEARAHVQLSGADEWTTGATRCDDDGRYVFEHLPAGSYMLYATCSRVNERADPFAAIDEARRSSVELEVAADSLVERDLHLDGARR